MRCVGLLFYECRTKILNKKLKKITKSYPKSFNWMVAKCYHFAITCLFVG